MSDPWRLTTMRLPLLLLGAVLALVLLPSPALAKGPIEASIDGPGLGPPLEIGDVENWGEEGALAATQPIMQFAEAAGFFPAAFGQVPDPMLARRPKGDLGPRYVVTYVVPGPTEEPDRIVQDLYPYAKPNPVTYMAPGQPLFGTQATRGGWFSATPSAAPLMSLLLDAGLPRTPPKGRDGSPFPWAIVGAVVAMGALLAFGAVAVVRIRRRPRPATT